MVRFKDEREARVMKEMRGGKGEVALCSILNGEEEMTGKGRLFSAITIEPGNSIGMHPHEGESETFYVVSGCGLYNDNGKEVPFGEGDVLHCAPGESHSIENTGKEPLCFVALILYA